MMFRTRVRVPVGIVPLTLEVFEGISSPNTQRRIAVNCSDCVLLVLSEAELQLSQRTETPLENKDQGSSKNPAPLP